MSERRRLESVRGVVLDLDGTVYDDRGVVAGAVEAIASVRAAGFGLRFATNTSRYPRSMLVERLRGLGIAAEPDDVLTAPRAAAAWLAAEGCSRVALHVPAPDPRRVRGLRCATRRIPEAAVVGDLGDDWTVDRMNRLFRQVLGGARLLAIQKNRYWLHEGALRMDAGPFVAAIEYATGAVAVVAGKPSPEFFRAAAASLDVPPAAVLVVGDDVRAEVEGARAAGSLGMLVRTGKFREPDLDHPAVSPDLVIDSVADLPAALGL